MLIPYDVFRFTYSKYKYFLSILIGVACVSGCKEQKISEFPNESNEEMENYSASARMYLFPSSNLLSNYWVSGDPNNNSGRVHSVVVDYSDSTHILAATAYGGIWNSNDFGDTWQPVNDRQLTLYAKWITQDPFNSDNYYYCTRQALYDSVGNPVPDIFKSTDGGNSFNVLPSSSFIPANTIKVVCSEADSNTVYGISTIINLTGSPTYLDQAFKSTDGGTSWQLLYSFNFPASVQDIIVFPNGAVLIGGGGNMYFSASGDSGTFTTIVNPFGLSSGAFTQKLFMDYCKASPNIVYAYVVASNMKRIFKSTDGGLTWIDQFDLTTLGTWSLLFGAIGVNPVNPDYVVVGDVAIAYSDDGGVTFSPFPIPSGPDFHQFIYNPHNPNQLIAGNDHDVSFKDISEPPQNAFIKKRMNRYTHLINAGDYNYSGNGMIIGCHDYGVRRNVGNSTFVCSGGDGTYCYIHKQDTLIGYLSNQNGVLVRYDDIYGLQGANYILNQLDTNNDNLADDWPMFIHPYEMNQADGNQLYFPTRYWLWRTTDRGDNWMKITGQLSDNNVPTVAISMSEKIDPTVCVAIDDTIWIKPNAATTGPGNEFAMAMPYDVENLFVNPDADSILMVTFKNQTVKVMRCSNILATSPVWQNITGNLPFDLTPNTLHVHPDDHDFIMLGTLNGLYITTDGGISWTREFNFPYVFVKQLRLRQSDKKLFIFTWGRGAWTADLPILSSISGHAVTDNKIKTYPNPFDEQLTLEQNEDLKCDMLKVFDIQGRLIFAEKVNPQQNKIILHTKNWQPGVYVYSCYSNHKIIFSGKTIRK